MQIDALIIGGGPAGATAALLLTRAGWSVAVVEKKTFPRRKVCGEFISATSLPLLKELGILDFYLSHAGPEIKRVGLFAKDSVLTSAMPFEKTCTNKWGRALGREHLDSLLLDEATRAGATVWQPWCVSQIADHQTHFICTLMAKEKSMEISARVVIMASGSWERSIVSHAPEHHLASDLLAFKAHFHNAALAPDLMPLLSFPGGYGGLVNTDAERITLSCCIRRDRLQSIRKLNPGLSAGDAVLHHISSTCTGARAVLSPAQRDGAWLAAGPLRPGIRKGYSEGVFYTGNSAGEAHPVVAEGISMAMQSAWILSTLLVKHQDETMTRQGLGVIGQTYSKQWKAQFANRIRAANFFAQMSMRPGVVNLCLPLFKQFPNLITYGAKLSGKINSIQT